MNIIIVLTQSRNKNAGQFYVAIITSCDFMCEWNTVTFTLYKQHCLSVSQSVIILSSSATSAIRALDKKRFEIEQII